MFTSLDWSDLILNSELPEIYVHLRYEVEQKYHDFAPKAIAGFLFG